MVNVCEGSLNEMCRAQDTQKKRERELELILRFIWVSGIGLQSVFYL